MKTIFYWAVGLFLWFFFFLNLKGVPFQKVDAAVIWDFIVVTALLPVVLMLLGFMGIIFGNSFKRGTRQYDRTRGDYYDRDNGGDGGGG